MRLRPNRTEFATFYCLGEMWPDKKADGRRGVINAGKVWGEDMILNSERLRYNIAPTLRLPLFCEPAARWLRCCAPHLAERGSRLHDATRRWYRALLCEGRLLPLCLDTEACLGPWQHSSSV